MTDSSPSGKDLPSGWSVSPLEDVADILDGKRVPVNAKERETRTGKVPYYGATGQVGWIDDYLFNEELVLLGEDGAPFWDASRPKAYVIRGKSWVNNHAHVLRAKDGTPNAYLKYFLDRFDYHGFVTGTTRLKLTQGAMRQIPIPLPSPEERNRIVAEIEKQFSRLDEAVANLKRAKANLKRYKAAVLKAAVEGRTTEEWRKQHPDVEPASKLLERILAERRVKWSGNGKYKEPATPSSANLLPLPSRWCWVTLDQTLWQLRSGTAETSKRELTEYPVLKSSAVRQGTIDFSDLNYLQKLQSMRPENFLKLGDFLITRLSGSVDYVGCSAVVKSSLCEGIQYPDRIFCGKLFTGVDGTYLSYCFQHPMIRKILEGAAKSTAGHQRISMSDLYPLTLPLPPTAEQVRIVAEVERRLSVIDELEATVDANLTRAQRLRQSILKEAFEGELIRQESYTGS